MLVNWKWNFLLGFSGIFVCCCADYLMLWSHFINYTIYKILNSPNYFNFFKLDQQIYSLCFNYHLFIQSICFICSNYHPFSIPTSIIHPSLLHLYQFSITFSVQWRYHHKLSRFCCGMKILFKLKFFSSHIYFYFLFFFETPYLHTINCMSVIYPGCKNMRKISI